MILTRVEKLSVSVSGICNQGSSHPDLEPLLGLIVGYRVGFRKSVSHRGV